MNETVKFAKEMKEMINLLPSTKGQPGTTVYEEDLVQVKLLNELLDALVTKYNKNDLKKKQKRLILLQSDCEYFLQNAYEECLYYKEVNKHCDAMLNLYNSFSDEEKPEWINKEKIEEYRKQMLVKKDNPFVPLEKIITNLEEMDSLIN